MRIKKILDEFLAECKNIFGEDLVSVVLFGSYARKKAKFTSDIDFLVILERLPDKWNERKKMFEKISRKIFKKYEKYIEVVPLTKEEFISNLNKFSSFLVTFILGNKILYDKNFFTPNFKAFASKLKEMDFIYCEGGKEWKIKEEAVKYLRKFG